VINFLQSGDFIFGNPSSIHSTGKKSKKFINETTEYLFNTFKLSQSAFSLVFHSGATEGINSFFKGIALLNFKLKKQCNFYFSTIDHAAVINLEADLKALGHQVYFFTVDKNGDFNSSKLIELIKNTTKADELAILNYTFVHNESGVVWPLDLALKIKNETGALVHVDAVQVVGKISNWNFLLSELDAYTFSAHKFGAMKSVGFTFLSKKVLISPWIVGGGQQNGSRSGTENALAIYSIKLALMDILDSFNPDVLESSKLLIESSLQGKCIVVAKDAKHRNLNTIFAIFTNRKSSELSARFDLQGVDVSTGSACSSGIIKENRILLNMGFTKEESLSAIRFSFSPLLNLAEATQISTIIQKILN
jgi:cysteine desulfurase